jgi:hypothetical protein
VTFQATYPGGYGRAVSAASADDEEVEPEPDPEEAGYTPENE